MKKKENKNNPDLWARSLGLAALIISSLSLYFQFFSFHHELIANVRNLDAQSDSIYFEVVLINNGDYDEIIKRGGFTYRAGNLRNERSQREFEFDEIRILKGEKKIISIAHPNIDKNTLWQFGITEDKLHKIDVFFYLKAVDIQGRNILSEAKIGQFEVQKDTSKWKDETPILMNLFDPQTTKEISDK
jgi:hypothetical protein